MTGADGVTDDAALGGRLRLLQPRRGHRFGHDAILLAAATDAQAGEHIVEFGAGVGLAGLALVWRVPGVRVTLVEIDPALAELARQNAERNHLADRVTVIAADVTGTGVGGLGDIDGVMMNPPYNDPARHRASPDAQRAQAHMGARGLLGAWCAAAARVLSRDGTLTLIWRADDLDTAQTALAPAFGALQLLPVHTRPNAPASLVLLAARKGGAATMTSLPGLTLNDEAGKPTAESERVLRDAEPLRL